MSVPVEVATRGALIVIEGLDKAGKSTQCERLIKNLEGRGHKIRHRRFPGKSFGHYGYRYDHLIGLAWLRRPNYAYGRLDQ